MATVDVTTLTAAELSDLRLAVLAERDRRARIEQAPQSIETAVRDAAGVGITEETIREAVDTALEGSS